MTTEKFGPVSWDEAASVYSILHHFRFGYSRIRCHGDASDADYKFDDLALELAQSPENPDTKEALRLLLHVRDLYKRTRERLIGD